MFLRQHLSFLLIALAVIVTACSSKSGTPTQTTPEGARAGQATSTNFVTARIAKTDLTPGSAAEATVTVTVQNGYHINANPATDTWLKATEVLPEAGGGFSVAFVKYPDALHKKFSFSDKELAVYEGEVPIKVMLKADATAARGPHTIPAKLNIQACDEQVCYAPGTLELSIPVLVN